MQKELRCTKGHLLVTRESAAGIEASCPTCQIELTHISILLKANEAVWAQKEETSTAV